jgi:hypothetical protein
MGFIWQIGETQTPSGVIGLSPTDLSVELSQTHAPRAIRSQNSAKITVAVLSFSQRENTSLALLMGFFMILGTLRAKQ